MKTLFSAIIPCFFFVYANAQVTPQFTSPDTVCHTTPVIITNTSTNASTYYWNFCVADINTPPKAVNIGNPGNLSVPVFMDYVLVNNNYYAFVANHSSGGLVRLDFGNSLLNTPTSVYLGTYGGILQAISATEGIQIVQNEGRWYAIVVGGATLAGTQPRIVKIDFGASITNPGVATDWGNLGNMEQPIDLHIFKEGNNWYGFTVNSENNTITRFDFTSSFNNTPTAINMGNLGALQYPTGIYAINDNGFWRVFITNGGDRVQIGQNSSITRLDFGNSLLNTPTAVNLGNPGGLLHHPRDLTIMKFCGQITGFVVNGAAAYYDLVRLNFNNDLTITPTAASLGNTGNYNFPHSISKLFRVNDEVYAFVTNAADNTISRLRFAGCTNASISSSTLKDPPPIIYSTPGTYNINLTLDDGLPTQTSICKQVVVIPPLVHAPAKSIDICAGDPIKIGTGVKNAKYTWNTGATTDSIIVNASGIYWVQTERYGCTNRDSIIVSYLPAPMVNLGPDIVTCQLNNLVLDAANTGAAYRWQDGSSAQTFSPGSFGKYYVKVTGANGCASSDTITITQKQTGLAELSFKQDVCNPLAVQFVSSGYKLANPYWDFGDGNSVTGNLNPSHTYPAFGNYTIKFGIEADGCKDTITQNVYINITRSDIILTPDTTICYNVHAQLHATPASRFCWSPTTYLSDPNIPNPVTSTPGKITYYYTADINGAILYDSVIISIDKPVVKTINDTIVCKSSPVLLAATGAATWSWTPATNLSDPAISNPIANPTATTDYIVSGTNLNGCAANDTVRIAVYPLPTVISNHNILACPNTAVQLAANNAMTTYAWSPVATLNNPAIANPIATPSLNTQYLVQVTDVNNCHYTDSVNVQFRITQFAATGINEAICQGKSSMLQATGGDTYLWSPADYLDNVNSATPIARPDTSIQYNVYIKENNCNHDTTITVQVKVNPIPTITAEKSNDIDCLVHSAKLRASGSAGSTYRWWPTSGLDHPEMPNPVTTTDTTITYVVTGTNKYGCSTKDSVTVFVTATGKISFEVPNAFTPNGDGRNDCFSVKTWGGVTIEEFSVFNRWGQRLFSSKNANTCWDGRFNGELQPAGGYTYVIKANSYCGPIKRTGIFMLIR